MQHLDEGLIAAFLDGETARAGQTELVIEQHLASCAECQHRLATARANRERARALLGRATPGDVSTPPFAEIQARARSAGARRRARRFPYRAVGAAAVVAIAAGLGWYLRGTVPGGMQLPDSPAPMSTGIEAAAPDAAAPAETTGLATRADEARDAQAGRETAGPVVLNRQDERAAETAKVAAPPPEPARNLLDSVGRAAQAAAPPRLDQRAPEEAAPAPARIAEFADDLWRAVPRQDAERALGGTVAVVAGLPIESHRVRVDAGEVAVRTTQVLPDGSELELVQRRGRLAAADAPAGAALRAERRRDAAADPFSVSSVEVDGFVVTGRARVAPDSLRALLALLRR